MIHKIIIALSLLLVISGAIWFFLDRDASLELQKTPQARGFEWLVSYTEQFSDPGILWVIETLNQRWCQSEALTRFVQEKFHSEFDSSSELSGYGVLLGLPAVGYDPAALQKNSFDDLILPALYCDTTQVSAATIKNFLDFDSASGYELTHKYLASLFMKERSCISAEADIQAINSAASKIADEQKHEKFDDLFAERTAFLFYGGYGELVKSEWIEEIERAQLSSGGWHDARFGFFQANLHTTALALWALTEAEGQCPVTDFSY